jgi:hypothetical protein
MFSTQFSSGILYRQVLRGLLAAGILFPLGATGCDKCNFLGSNYADNSLGDQVRQYRKPDSDAQMDGVSAKSQQIEKDLGY